MPPILLLFLLLPLAVVATTLSDSDRRVLLISLDGFKHSLLTEKLVPHLHKFASERSSWFTKGVKSQMLTVTAANHMSIVSGLREDEHGVVGNYFWDRTKGEMYDKFNIAGGADLRNQSELSKWNPLDPIWLLNQKNGGRSTVINWPAGDYERSEDAGVKMTRYRPSGFGDISGWPRELQLVLDSLANNNLVLWYIAEPDSTLHGKGFKGGHLETMLTKLDDLFDKLIKGMEEKDLLKTTDIILTADHGHIQVTPGKTLCVNTILGTLAADPEYHAGDSNIYHSDLAKVQEMFAKLKAAIEAGQLPYRVYLQKDVPATWHYVNAATTGDIVIEPLPGGQVKMKCKSGHDDSHTSTHGQDPNLHDMRALLVLSGPSFKAGEKFSAIPENIDLFPLMLRLLGIQKEPHHNGVLTHLTPALREQESGSTGEMADTTEKTPGSSTEVRMIVSILVVLLMMIVH